MKLLQNLRQLLLPSRLHIRMSIVAINKIVEYQGVESSFHSIHDEYAKSVMKYVLCCKLIEKAKQQRMEK